MPVPLILAGTLGKWRYFLTGLPLAVLFALVCRALGLLAALPAEMRVFRGICEEIAHGPQTRILVSFQDGSRLSHRAAFVTAEPQARKLKAGDPVRFAVRRSCFASGSYPQTLEAASENGDILLRSEHLRRLHRRLLKTVLCQLLICGAALAVFLISVKLCFP